MHMVYTYTIRASSNRRKNIIIIFNVTHKTSSKNYQLQRSAALSNVRGAARRKGCEGFCESQLKIGRYH